VKTYAVGRFGGRTPWLPIYILHNYINQSMSDTWHPQIGPRVLTPFASYRTLVTPRFDNHQPTKTCHITTLRSYFSVRSCHVRLYGLYDWYNQHLFFFACLAWRTDRDIFFIRSPFDKVNIPPESGR
jgi:hypothetical protein